MSDSIDDFGTLLPKKGNGRDDSICKHAEVSESPRELKEGESNSAFLRQYTRVDTDSYMAVGECCNILPAGLYTYRFASGQPLYIKREIHVDELINFPDSLSERVLREIGKFWSSAEKFLEYGFLQRRGYLFYGPQGSGKSCLVQLIVKGIIERNGLAFICDDNADVFGKIVLRNLRNIEPKRPIVCLFEDIDAMISRSGESEILSLLDGEIQINNVLNIATTNYPERLDKRIVARPRRFDRLIKITMPGSKIRHEYFERKLKNATAEEIDLWTTSTTGFSFAALADLVISVKCLGNPFEDTLSTLKKLQTKSASSKEFEEATIGFNRDNGSD
ncbi:MAG: ATP-binding protein [Methanogenium sp.]|jgi:AAA+ superfamily predicted ATPase